MWYSSMLSHYTAAQNTMRHMSTSHRLKKYGHQLTVRINSHHQLHLCETSPLWQILFFLLFWPAFKVSNITVTTLLCFLKNFVFIWERHFPVHSLRSFRTLFQPCTKILFYVQRFVQMTLLNMWFALLVILFMLPWVVLSLLGEKNDQKPVAMFTIQITHIGIVDNFMVLPCSGLFKLVKVVN